MDRKTWWISAIILALIIGGVAYLYVKKDTPTKKDEQSQQQAVDTPASPDKENPEPVAGRYIAYSPDAVKDAKGDILLFFHAPWCPQCREIEKTINSGPLPDNLTLFKVDYDSNQALRQQYDVTLQTTFVKIDKDGNKIKSYVAYGEPTFEAVKRELLP